MVQYVANLKGRNVGLIKTKWRSLYKDHVIWFASPSCPLPSRSFLKAKLDVRPKDEDLKVPWHHEENSWVVTPPIQIWCLMGFELNAVCASQDAWSTCKSIWGLSIQQKSNPNQPRDSPSGRRIDLSCLDATTQYMFSKNGKVEESRRMRIWPTKVNFYHVYAQFFDESFQVVLLYIVTWDGQIQLTKNCGHILKHFKTISLPWQNSTVFPGLMLQEWDVSVWKKRQHKPMMSRHQWHNWHNIIQHQHTSTLSVWQIGIDFQRSSVIFCTATVTSLKDRSPIGPSSSWHRATGWSHL